MQQNEEQQSAVALLFCKRNDIVQPYHVMRKQSLVIGRNNSLSLGNYDSECVDIDLGPFTRFVSRKHFRIRHCFDDAAARNCFIGDILGKNGVFVDGDFYRAGVLVELPSKCFLRFPSTDICISFISLLQSESHNGNSNSQPGESLNAALVENELLQNGADVDYSKNRLCTTRPCSPSGTISAFNSCPPSPRRSQQQPQQSVAPLMSSSPFPSDKHQKRSCIVLYAGGGSVHENNYNQNIPDEARNSDVLPVDDTIVLDEDIAWDPTIDRDSSAIVAIGLGDDIGDVAGTSSANLLDFHDSDAQMPPLSDDDSNSCNNNEHFMPSTVVPDSFDSGGIDPLNREDGLLTPENNLIDGDSDLLPSVETSKPALSYVQLIAQAILSSPSHRMPLKRIYDYISRRYPHYRMSDKGWQNSLRHTLSLSPYFTRADRLPGELEKAGSWTVTEKYHQSLNGSTGPIKRIRTKKPPKPVQSSLKQKAIAPAPLPPPPPVAPQITFLSSAQTMPMVQPIVQPVTILLSPGNNGMGTTYTVLQHQQPQPQLIYLQCLQPTSFGSPISFFEQSSYQNITLTAANSANSGNNFICVPVSDNNNNLDYDANGDNTNSTSQLASNNNSNSMKKAVVINNKKIFLTPVDVSPCTSSASFSSYFPK